MDSDTYVESDTDDESDISEESDANSDHGDQDIAKDSESDNQCFELEDEFLLRRYSSYPSEIFFIEEVDPLAGLVQQNIKRVWSREHIMYTLIEWGLSFALNYESGKVPEVPSRLKNFLESLAFNSQQKAYNLLRGQGSVETKDSGISKQSFQWTDYNIVLPSYKAILKHKPPPLSGEGVLSSQLQNMLRLAENKSEPSFEDN